MKNQLITMASHLKKLETMPNELYNGSRMDHLRELMASYDDFNSRLDKDTGVKGSGCFNWPPCVKFENKHFLIN